MSESRLLDLIGRRTGGWCKARVCPTVVGILGRAHLDVGLASAEVALVFTSSIVATRILCLVIGRRRLCLLCLIAGIVLRLPMAKRCVPCPTSTVERLATGATSSSSAKATAKTPLVWIEPWDQGSRSLPAQEEEEECGKDDDAEGDPSTPIVP